MNGNIGKRGLIFGLFVVWCDFQFQKNLPFFFGLLIAFLHTHTQWVIGVPDVREFDLDGTEEFLVLGCDGLWDCMKEDEVVAFVKDARAKSGDKV